MSLGLTPRPPVAPAPGQRTPRLPRLDGDSCYERSPRLGALKARLKERCDGNADASGGSERRRQLELIKKNRRRRHAAEDVCRGEWSDIDCKRKWDELRQERSKLKERVKTRVHLERLPGTKQSTEAAVGELQLPHLVVEVPLPLPGETPMTGNCQRQSRETQSLPPPRSEEMLLPQSLCSPRLPQLRQSPSPTQSLHLEPLLESSQVRAKSSVDPGRTIGLPEPSSAPMELGGQSPLDLEGLEEDDADAPLHATLHSSLQCESPLFQWTGSLLKSPSNAASTDIQEEIRCDPEPPSQGCVRIPYDKQAEVGLQSSVETATALATTCACGVVFIPDSLFCRMCGARRLGRDNVEVIAAVPVAPKEPAPDGRFNRKELLRQNVQPHCQEKEQVAQSAAATTIQSAHRARQAQKEVSLLRVQQQKAATTIQAHHRGCQIRKRHSQSSLVQVSEATIIEETRLDDDGLWLLATQRADESEAKDTHLQIEGEDPVIDEDDALWALATRAAENTVPDARTSGDDDRYLVHASLAEDVAKAVLFGDCVPLNSNNFLTVAAHLEGDGEDAWSQASSPYCVLGIDDEDGSNDHACAKLGHQGDEIEDLREDMRQLMEAFEEDPHQNSCLVSSELQSTISLEDEGEKALSDGLVRGIFREQELPQVAEAFSETSADALEVVREKVFNSLGRALEEGHLREAMRKVGITLEMPETPNCQDSFSADLLDDMKETASRSLCDSLEDSRLKAALEQEQETSERSELELSCRAANEYREELALAEMKAGVCGLLLEASGNGCLQAAIRDLNIEQDRPLAEDDKCESQKAAYREALVRSCDDGTSALLRRNGRLQEMKETLHGALLRALDDGTLHQRLEELQEAPTPICASESHTTPSQHEDCTDLCNGVGNQAREPLPVTVDDGSLERAMPEVLVSAPIDEMALVRKQMHERLFRSASDGSLEAALRNATEKPDLDSLQLLKNPVTSVLVQGSEDGSLQQFIAENEELSTPMELSDLVANSKDDVCAPIDAIDVMRKQLHDKLLCSASDGSLELTLQDAKSTEDLQNSADDIQAIQTKDLGCFEQAHTDGSLEGLSQEPKDETSLAQATQNQAPFDHKDESLAKNHTLERMKRQVGSLLMNAASDGSLDTILSKNQTHERTRKDLESLLLQANEDGMLKAVVLKEVQDSTHLDAFADGLVVIPTRFNPELEEAKNLTREILLRSQEEGDLEAALQKVLPPLDLSLDFLTKDFSSCGSEAVVKSESKVVSDEHGYEIEVKGNPIEVSLDKRNYAMEVKANPTLVDSDDPRLQIMVKENPMDDLTRLQESELQCEWKTMEERLAERIDVTSKIVDDPKNIPRMAPDHATLNNSAGSQRNEDTLLSGDWIRGRWDELRNPEMPRPGSRSGNEAPKEDLRDLTSIGAFQQKLKLIKGGDEREIREDACSTQSLLPLLDSGLASQSQVPPPPNFAPPMCPSSTESPYRIQVKSEKEQPRSVRFG